MNLQGTGKKLTPGDYERAARDAGINDTNKLRAIVQVEALGSGFGAGGLLKCLYEPHIAYRMTSGKTRAKLQAAGLAYARWGAKPYSPGPYANHLKVLKAAAIVGDKAFEFASWGLPQMMGFNARSIGYASAKSMVEDMLKGEAEQLAVMVKFLVHKNLIEKINAAGSTAHSWAPVAYVYNGSSYKKHGYHIKLAAAYTPDPNRAGHVQRFESTVLMRGDKGPNVFRLQSQLNELGFVLLVDADFGRSTEQAVRAFQRGNNLVVDGVVGPATLARLNGMVPSKTKPVQGIGGPKKTAPAAGKIPVIDAEPAPPVSLPSGKHKPGFWATLFAAIFGKGKAK